MYMHRMILDPPHGMFIDHINGNGLDNRRENIRLVTPSQNALNARRAFRNKQSKYRGVSISQAPGVEGLWVAFIRANKKHKNLGYFKDEEAAARAYDDAAKVLHGEFARLNFP